MATPLQNKLIAALEPASQEYLLARTTQIQVPQRMMFYEACEIPQYVYFPLEGLASVVSLMADGSSAEVGLVGREGLVGAMSLLGPAKMPTQCFAPMEGSALRIPVAEMREVVRTSKEIRSRVYESVQEQYLSISQLAGCNRLHEADRRLARWLLMANDRSQNGGVLNLTQEFIAEMLGTRRTTVTAVAGTLQTRGLIEYRRGQVRILDRPGLEQAACSCYGVLKGLFLGLYRNEVPADE